MDVRASAFRKAVVVVVTASTMAIALSTAASGTVPVPHITKCTPLAGAAIGKPMAIDGTGLAGATKVTFNAVATTPAADTADLIKAKVPTGAKVGSDTIHVTTPGGTATCPFKVKKKTKK